MGLGRLQARGQVTIPQEVRRAAGLEPGDVILFEVFEPGILQATALPHHTSMDAVLARFGSDGCFDPQVWERVGDDIARDVVRDNEKKDGKRG